MYRVSRVTCLVGFFTAGLSFLPHRKVTAHNTWDHRTVNPAGETSRVLAVSSHQGSRPAPNGVRQTANGNAGREACATKPATTSRLEVAKGSAGRSPAVQRYTLSGGRNPPSRAWQRATKPIVA